MVEGLGCGFCLFVIHLVIWPKSGAFYAEYSNLIAEPFFCLKIARWCHPPPGFKKVTHNQRNTTKDAFDISSGAEADATACFYALDFTAGVFGEVWIFHFVSVRYRVKVVGAYGYTWFLSVHSSFREVEWI
jgi:hypothetical protein